MTVDIAADRALIRSFSGDPDPIVVAALKHWAAALAEIRRLQGLRAGLMDSAVNSPAIKMMRDERDALKTEVERLRDLHYKRTKDSELIIGENEALKAEVERLKPFECDYPILMENIDALKAELASVKEDVEDYGDVAGAFQKERNELKAEVGRLKGEQHQTFLVAETAVEKRLKAENQRLQEALAFYAADINWLHYGGIKAQIIRADGGFRARNALAGGKP